MERLSWKIPTSRELAAVAPFLLVLIAGLAEFPALAPLTQAPSSRTASPTSELVTTIIESTPTTLAIPTPTPDTSLSEARKMWIISRSTGGNRDFVVSPKPYAKINSSSQFSCVPKQGMTGMEKRLDEQLQARGIKDVFTIARVDPNTKFRVDYGLAIYNFPDKVKGEFISKTFYSGTVFTIEPPSLLFLVARSVRVGNDMCLIHRWLHSPATPNHVVIFQATKGSERLMLQGPFAFRLTFETLTSPDPIKAVELIEPQRPEYSTI